MNFTNFKLPQRAIYCPTDLDKFKDSECAAELQQFVKLCGDSVFGIPTSQCSPESPEIIEKFVTFMNKLRDIVKEIPPIKQPMRFGNKAFRNWHERLCIEVPEYLRSISTLEQCEGAVMELAPYLCGAFGNETRIDFGTGHELNFAIFFFCIFKLGLIGPSDFRQVVLQAFTAYIKTVRCVQETYVLEPAGSHGVWGLDDYHCLSFVWGAAQLCNNDLDIVPSSIHHKDILLEYSNEFIYLEGISFIQRLKCRAPFAETSPMLNDISQMGDWTRVLHGLLRLFQGEVLFKLPVVQHLLFGSLFCSSWQATMPAAPPAAASIVSPTQSPTAAEASRLSGGAATLLRTGLSGAGLTSFRQSSASSSLSSGEMQTKAPWAK